MLPLVEMVNGTAQVAQLTFAPFDSGFAADRRQFCPDARAALQASGEVIFFNSGALGTGTGRQARAQFGRAEENRRRPAMRLIGRGRLRKAFRAAGCVCRPTPRSRGPSGFGSGTRAKGRSVQLRFRPSCGNCDARLLRSRTWWRSQNRKPRGASALGGHAEGVEAQGS